ncbi:MAG: DUF58 domain-containing protein [Thermus caldifontis]
MAGLLGLLSLLLLLALWRAPRFAQVRVKTHGLAPGFPGQEGEGQVEVEVWAPLPLFFRLENLPSAPLGLEPRGLSGMAWGKIRLALPLSCRYRRRGEHPLRLILRLTSPLGLGERLLSLEAGRVLVYPSLRPLPPFEPAPSFFLEGRPEPFGLPDPLEAKGLRPYGPGDSLRLLAKQASLRQGRPFVREVEKSLLGSLFLHLDTQSLHPAYLDHAASLAAWLLLLAEKKGAQYGLSAGEVLPLGRGKAHLVRALSLLARLQPTPGPSLPPKAPFGSTYFLISQGAEESFLEATLRGAAQARQGVLLLLPEGYFLYPGEKGRVAFGKTPGLARALAMKGLLLAHGVSLRVVRGHQTLTL